MAKFAPIGFTLCHGKNIIPYQISDNIDNIQITEDINDADVLIIGPSVTSPELESIIQFKGIKILLITEPITKFSWCKHSNWLYQNKMYDYAFGQVPNSEELKTYKLPMHRSLFNLHTINEYTARCSMEKKFCSLISRHDPSGIRTKIYNALTSTIPLAVDCPGRLLNNCSNTEVNEIGIPKYLNQYYFNICCENFGCSHKGYITEKLYNCCLGGAIPIYYGELDDVDRKIFNTDRILIVNEDLSNLSDIVNNIFHMLMNPKLLEKFYRQPVFMHTAANTLDTLHGNVRKILMSLNFEL